MAPEFYEVSPEPDFEPIPIYTGIVAEDTRLGEKAEAKKQPAKLSRQQERDNAIVQSAIEAASKQATSTSRKRSHSIHENDIQSTPAPAGKPAKKPSAFSKMMAASKKKEEWTPMAADSRPWTHVFEQALAEVKDYGLCGRYLGENEWANAVSQSIVQSVNCIIIPHIFERCSTQHKLNALHALIEIASAIAYAPQSKASDLVRTGKVPPYLINEMFKITDLMSDIDIKRVISEKAFVGKVRELRHEPRIFWTGNTWTALDDVLRVFKDPGPVDFRRIYQRIEDNASGSYARRKSVKWVVNIIHNEISGYLNGDTCFETRYNAMNVLIDIAALMLKHHSEGYGESSIEAKLLNEALSEALLKIGKTLEPAEVEQVLAEIPMPEILLSRFLQKMQMLMDRDLLSMKIPNSNDQHLATYKTLNMLQTYINEKKNTKSRDYCKNGLLAKILHLRIDIRNRIALWATSWDNLDDTIELFVDSSLPVNFDHYLRKIESAVSEVGPYYFGPDQTQKLRHSFEHSIMRITARASGRACSETKLNALRTLAKVGLKIGEWFDLQRPQWQKEVFADHISEDMLTDAIMAICQSLAKTNALNCLSDQGLLDDLKELDSRRAKIPEAMEGLDAVLNVIRDPDLLTSKGSKRAKVAAIPETAHVIDLTND
jgi:hypothetical protein